MAHIVEKLDYLNKLDSGIHWFCPRSHADDYTLYYDEDLVDDESKKETAVRNAKIEEAKERRKTALAAFEIIAFDGDDAVRYQEKLKTHLHTQLTRCDICVREFHRSRTLLKETLETDYSEEDVAEFMQKYDSMNNSRIVAGLNVMTDTLMDLPPEERSIGAAGEVGMYALFEALNCIPFLKDDDLLRESFDKPFRLVQSKKKVKLPSYAPGMGAFLFSSFEERNAWATRNFGQIKRTLQVPDFEYCIQPFLGAAIKRVDKASLQLDFLPVFWRGVRLMLSKLTKELVTNHLRAMDSNLILLSLDHLLVDSFHFSDLVASYQILLNLSSHDFWEAMGSASPQSVIETICKSPSLERLLTITVEKEPLRLEEKMAWAITFVHHITPRNLVPPLRALLNQFLKTFQDSKYSRYARNVTWHKGLVCLKDAIQIVSEKVDGGPVCTHLIEAVSEDHMPNILQELDGVETKTEMGLDENQHLALQIVESILALDVKGLSRDRRIIVNTQQLDRELEISGLKIWKKCMRHIKGGNPALPCAVFAGIKGLLSLEKIPPSQVRTAQKHAEGWNNAFQQVLTITNTNLLERVENFSSDHVIDLLQDPSGAQGLMSLLLSGDESIHSATLGIFKTLSYEDERRACIMHLLKAFSGNVLSAIASSLRIISDAEVYTPCSTMLKICIDIYSCLCDSNDGVLRANPFTSRSELQALKDFWRATWSTLMTIFEQTETWSRYGYEKSRMQDMCRETMDLADSAFDQYAIIAATLKEAAPSKDNDVGKDLLQSPNETFRSITKWLRLRDDYLVSKAVGLTGKILVRLQQVGIKTSDEGLRYLEDIVVTGHNHVRVKTNLSMNQKAELQRALEQHTGEPIRDVLDRQATAQKRQSSLQDWASSSSRSSTPVSGARTQGIRDAIWPEQKKRIAALKEKEERDKAELALRQKQQSNDFVAKRQQAKAEQERAKLAALARETGGGSGLKGFGDFGKVHTPKGQNVMVSSDEESDEDEEDGQDEELFGPSLSKEKKKKKELPALVPYGALGMKPEQKEGPTKIRRLARSQKDRKARLAPNLAPLHVLMLGWEYFHDEDTPPSFDSNSCIKISPSFNDHLDYQRTFEPLLTLEAWQGMVKSKEERTSTPYEIKVQNRSNVDAFLEISSIMSQQENRDRQLMEGDIILLSKASQPASEEQKAAPHCLARIYRVKRQQKAQVEIVYQTTQRNGLSSHLTPQAVIHGQKVHSITPLEREYGALKSLEYYDLLPQIVKGKPSPRINFSSKQIAALQDVYNVNRAQSEAINAALENDGFTLIQGPPGSGKTKTIVAVVGGLLSQTLSSTSKGATKIAMPNTNGFRNDSGEGPSKKLLVCAPSNAAVDEIVMRLKDGVKTKSGISHQLNIVRLGRSDAINAQVADVTMDELVAKKMGKSTSDPKTREKNSEIFNEHQQVSRHLTDLYQQRDNGEVKGEELTKLESTLAGVRKRKNELGIQIDNLKDQERNAGRDAELNRRRAQQAVLDSAHVICATLSGSGHDMFQNLNIEFETVIIDEAAQCVEVSSLIPLKYGCIKCIMVGDPKQLPPTILSEVANVYQYEQALFVRMQQNFPDDVHLLDTQYRMHPDISLFPSRAFYDDRLKDGQGMAALRRQPWHKSALLAPYRFFDVKGQHSAKGHSLINDFEINIAMAIYDRLVTDFKDYDFTGKIGIITPYKAQLKELKVRFAKRFGQDVFDTIEFNTTDAFQGRESEVIIFSCVRASSTGNIGFLKDIRRMNVGLTRAKSSLWVLGNAESLTRENNARGKQPHRQMWKELIDDAQARDCYTTGNVGEMLAKPSNTYLANEAKDTSMNDVSAHVAQTDDSSKGRLQPTSGNAHTDTSTFKAEPQSDKMDGIRYRAQDRFTKSHNQSSIVPNNRNGSLPETVPEDVAMGDSDDRRSAAPAETLPRADTNHSGKVDRPTALPPSATQTVRKRPAANGTSPFIPRRRQPRPPQ